MKNIKSLISIMIVFVVSITLFSGCINYAIALNKHEVNQTENASFDNISKIDVDAVGSEIEIIVENRSDVEATFIGSLYTAGKEEPELIIKDSGNTMEIYIDYGHNNMNIGEDRTDLTIYIPSEYAEDIIVHSVSGNVKSDKLNIDDLEIHNVSGDVQVDQSNLADLDINTISGKVIGDTIQADTMDFDTVSGNINLTYCDTERVKANSISGNIILSIPDSAYLDIDTSTVSGKVHTEDGHSTSKENAVYMDLSTVSGNIDINRYSTTE